MAGISIDVQIGDREVRDFLNRRKERAKDLRPAYGSIGEYMLREIEARFAGEHDPEGGPWTPLSPLTIAKKKTDKILTEDSYLRGDIHYIATGDHVSIGTAKVYGAIHQLGGKAGRGKKVTIDARPYLGVNDDNRNEFLEIVKDHILSG